MLNWLRSLVEGRIILHKVLSIVGHQRFHPLKLELNPADDKVEAVVCALLPEATVHYPVELGVGNRKESFLQTKTLVTYYNCIFAGILRDKTKANKFMYIPMIIHKITPSVEKNYWLKRSDT